MKKSYLVEGMTCGGCIATVKNGLVSVPGVQSAEVRLESPQVTLTLDREPDIRELQMALGKYRISPSQNAAIVETNLDTRPEPSLSTYRPLILIVTFIAGVSLFAQYPFDQFSGMLWMQHFMAGFFIVFAFFKLLNLRGFAESYSMYDVVAARWYSWGLIYPFVELTLGALYLTNIAPFATNIATVIVLGISSIGVIESNLNKRKIRCACLGDVFNLPMSTVTIIEDLGMVGMAILMLMLM